METQLPPPRTINKSVALDDILTHGFRLLLAGSLWAIASIAHAVMGASQDYPIAERGEDYAIYRKLTPVTGAAGHVQYRTNEFTLLENGLHYFENGEWKVSEDLIEPFPEGAVARRGPHKAIFSPDLNAEAVFDIQTSDGKRQRGGVRAIQLTDLATGKSVVLGTVKKSAPGKLLPPNQIVYADGFDGLKADVLLVWKHNLFSQDVLLRERPELPAGLNPDSTVLEVVSEFVEAPAPKIREQRLTAAGKPEVADHVLISLGGATLVQGKAFPMAGDNAVNLSAWRPDLSGVPVAKQWQELTDGRRFLIESIGWRDVRPLLQDLPVVQRADNGVSAERKAMTARVWPARDFVLRKPDPIQLASLPYQPTGYIVDMVEVINGSATDKTFFTGMTYYIQTSYSVGAGNAIFQPGCFVKYKNNAYLLLFGDMSFPLSGQAVFTSRNDDVYGDKIVGIPGEPDSDGNPTAHQAAQAIWMYFLNTGFTITHSRIRWAQKGVQYDANPGVTATHTISNTVFDQCQIGVQNNMPNGVVSLSNVNQCGVTTSVSGTGSTSGSMTVDCGVVNASKTLDHQFEPAIGVNPTNPSQVVIVSIWQSTPASMLQMVSSDGGSTWTTDALPLTGMDTPDSDSDPSLAFDDWGNLFLAYRSNLTGTVGGFSLCQHERRYKPESRPWF